MGVRPERSLDYPVSCVPIYLVPFIPHSAIAKTVLLRSLIFHFSTSVENKPLKQRLKQKNRIIVTNLLNIFSFASFYEVL